MCPSNPATTTPPTPSTARPPLESDVYSAALPENTDGTVDADIDIALPDTSDDNTTNPVDGTSSPWRVSFIR